MRALHKKGEAVENPSEVNQSAEEGLERYISA